MDGELYHKFSVFIFGQASPMFWGYQNCHKTYKFNLIFPQVSYYYPLGNYRYILRVREIIGNEEEIYYHPKHSNLISDLAKEVTVILMLLIDIYGECDI
jgi:hypothetical protein